MKNLIKLAKSASMLTAILSSTVYSANSCEVWVGSQQVGGVETYVTWNFTEGHSPGLMLGYGSSTSGDTYTVKAVIPKNNTSSSSILVQRLNSRMGSECDYTGLRIGSMVSGSVICTDGSDVGMWSANISVCS